MSVLIVGSTALDSIKTPKKENPRLLGGSASHAAVAASNFAPVRLVGIVGKDFPKAYLNLYKRRGLDLEGLDIADGKTFHWSGEYEANMNNRRTLLTELGVFETFNPTLPESYRSSEYVLLANIAPGLQHRVLDQMKKPRLVAADTMDLWLNIALPELLKLVKRLDLFVLNDSEAYQLTKEENVFCALAKLHKLGPEWVIIKQGSHGSILSGPGGYFLCPAYPLGKVVDPTGAGDSFVGAIMGYLSATGGAVKQHIRQAMIYGSVVASFCCEGFGLQKTAGLTQKDIERRARELRDMTAVD